MIKRASLIWPRHIALVCDWNHTLPSNAQVLTAITKHPTRPTSHLQSHLCLVKLCPVLFTPSASILRCLATRGKNLRLQPTLVLWICNGDFRIAFLLLQMVSCSLIICQQQQTKSSKQIKVIPGLEIGLSLPGGRLVRVVWNGLKMYACTVHYWREAYDVSDRPSWALLLLLLLRSMFNDRSL